MFIKKEEELFDLEAVMPKEYKEEALKDSGEIVTVPQPGITDLTQVCYLCSRGSHEAVLIPVLHRGIEKWVCPKCLKSAIDADSQSSYSSSPEFGVAGSGLSNGTGGGSTENSEYRSPMSMFD